jgi:anti-sigma factor RsiW
MEQRCHTFSTEQISQFIDNELEQDQADALSAHLNQCDQCRQIADQYQALSNAFQAHVTHQVDKIDTTILTTALNKAEHRSGQRSWKDLFGRFGQNIYLKLSFITAILVISLVSFQANWFKTTGPSAIVQSVDTNDASVMIFETQKEKHTIIWFTETS